MTGSRRIRSRGTIRGRSARDWTQTERQRRAASNRFFASDGAAATTPYIIAKRQNNLIMPWTERPNSTALARTVDCTDIQNARGHLMELKRIILARLPPIVRPFAAIYSSLPAICFAGHSTDRSLTRCEK